MADEINNTPTLNEGLRLTLNLPETNLGAIGDLGDQQIAPQQAATQVVQPQQDEQKPFADETPVDDKPATWGSQWWTDIALSPFRGILAAGQSAYELMDTVTLDALPDIQGKLGGYSKTDAGKIIENISQFATGFAISGGALGAAFKGVQAAKVLANPMVGGAIKGLVTDFSFMDAHQDRLANLIQDVPQLQNPIAAYLASDKDEGDLEGRLKNALEGLGLGIALDSAVHMIGSGVKALKNAQKLRLEGKEPQVVADALNVEIKPLKAEAKEAEVAAPKVEDSPVVTADDGSIAIKSNVADAPQAVVATSQDIDTLVIDAIRAQNSDTSLKVMRKILQTAKTSDDIANTIKAIANVVEQRAKDVKPSGWQDIAAVMRKQLDDSIASGGRPANIENELLQHSSPLQYPEVAAKALAARRLYSMHIQAEAERIGKMITDGTFTDEEAIQTAELLHAAYKVIDIDKKLATGTSRALSSRREDVFKAVSANEPIPQAPIKDAAKGAEQQVTKEADKASTSEQFKSLFNNNFKEYLAQNPAQAKRDLKRVMDMLAKGDDPMEVAETAAKSMSVSGKIMDTTLELFVNNLFSLKTCVVNAMSGSMQLLLRPLEIAIGGGMDKSSQLYLKQAFHQMSADMSQAVEYFKKSFVEERGTFGATQVEIGDMPKAISADYWDLQAEKNPVAAMIVNGLGRGVRVFSATNQAMDSAVKFLAMRSNAAGRFMTEAYDKGLQGVEAQAFVHSKLKSFFNERGLVNSQSGAFLAAAKEANEQGLKGMARVEYINNRAVALWDSTRESVGDFIQQQGREVTNTRDFGDNPGFWGTAANDMAALVKKNPQLRFFVPFVKTPAQLLRWVAEHTPTGGPLKSLNKTTLEELTSADPLVRAGARGRLRVGTALWATAGAIAASGKITGYGPTDPRERKALMATGWKPYSFKLGNTYIQFSRLDPIASFFGIAADVNEQIRTGVEQDDGFLSTTFQAAWLPLQRNFTNKTYMRGLTDMLDILNSSDDTSIERATLNRIAVLIPSGLANSAAALGNDFSVGSSTQPGDYLLRRIPGLTGLVDRNRNILGEAINVTPEAARAVDAFNPFVVGYNKGDKVVNELAELRHPFSPPSKKLGNVVDLTSYTNDKGQTAYDRYAELVGTVQFRGATLRKEMSKLFASSQYKSLPTRVQSGEMDARVTAVNRLISKYRAKAREQLLQEFPEVSKAWGKKQLLDIQTRKSVKGLRSLI